MFCRREFKPIPENSPKKSRNFNYCWLELICFNTKYIFKCNTQKHLSRSMIDRYKLVNIF